VKENFCIENWEWSTFTTKSIFICTAAEEGFVTCEFYAGGRYGGPCIYSSQHFDDVRCGCTEAIVDSRQEARLKNRMEDL